MFALASTDRVKTSRGACFFDTANNNCPNGDALSTDARNTNIRNFANAITGAGLAWLYWEVIPNTDPHVSYILCQTAYLFFPEAVVLNEAMPRTARTTRSALAIRPGAPCRVSRSKHSRPRVPSISPSSSFEAVLAISIRSACVRYHRICSPHKDGTCAPIYSRAREAYRQVTSRLLLQCLAGGTNTQATRLHQYATYALIQLLSAIASLSTPSLLTDDEGARSP